jgi:hypothetical protein
LGEFGSASDSSDKGSSRRDEAEERERRSDRALTKASTRESLGDSQQSSLFFREGECVYEGDEGACKREESEAAKGERKWGCKHKGRCEREVETGRGEGASRGV